LPPVSGLSEKSRYSAATRSATVRVMLAFAILNPFACLRKLKICCLCFFPETDQGEKIFGFFVVVAVVKLPPGLLSRCHVIARFCPSQAAQ
jgi:hypothetical protein